MKPQIYVPALIAGTLLIVLGIKGLNVYLEEEPRINVPPSNGPRFWQSRPHSWSSAETSGKPAVARSSPTSTARLRKSARKMGGRYSIDTARWLADSSIVTSQLLKVAIGVEELNAIPQSNPVAREGALGELIRLDPDNPRWKRELLAAQKAVEAQKRKDAEHEKQRQREELALRRREGVTIGMTQERVLQSSWGRPEKINRTMNASGTREQWVYGNGRYLYFQNGVLTSIQTSK